MKRVGLSLKFNYIFANLPASGDRVRGESYVIAYDAAPSGRSAIGSLPSTPLTIGIVVKTPTARSATPAPFR